MTTSVVVCDGSLPGKCPAVRVELTWSDWLDSQLKWPLIVQLALTIIFLTTLEPVYSWTYGQRYGRFRQVVKAYLGTDEHPKVSRPQWLICIYGMQIIVSLATVAIWVIHTYRRSTMEVAGTMELVTILVDILTWMVNRLRGQCRATSLWQLNGLIDALTVVPTLQRAMQQRGAEQANDLNWLSLQFLRSYSALFSFQRIQETGHLQYNAVIVQMFVQVIFQVFCLLTVMAGTIFTCELLGDPPWLTDSFLETQFGDRISFLQMVYWVMVSVTTVGYGDFAPRSTVARVLSAIFIVIGLSAIFFLEMRVIEFVKRRWEGSGRYRRRSKHQKHVVLVLCPGSAVSQLSTVVAGFLQEILHSTHDPNAAGEGGPCRCCGKRNQRSSGWPDVVFFSPSNWDDMDSNGDSEESGSGFSNFLRRLNLPSAARSRVTFIVGKVSSKTDLARAAIGSSSLALLVGDPTSECPDEADRQNIVAAVIIRTFYPSTRLRVMLIRPESKDLAVQAGMPVSWCISFREMKANMLAQNVRCHGIVPMIVGMLCSADQDDEAYFLSTALHHRSWRQDIHEKLKVQRYDSDDETRGSTGTEHDSIGSLASETCSGSHKLDTPVFAKTHSALHMRSLKSLKRRLQESHHEWSDVNGGFERSKPWEFFYFDGLCRSMHGFELASAYAGSTFGELVHEVYKVTGSLLIGIFDQGRVLLCPQHTHKRHLQTGQICFAVTDDPKALDPVSLKGCQTEDWRTRIMAAVEAIAFNSASLGAHLEASKICAQHLQDVFVQRGNREPAEPGSPTCPVPNVDSYSLGQELTQPVSRRSSLNHIDETESCLMDDWSSCNQKLSETRMNLNTLDDPMANVEMLRRSLGDNEELVLLIVCAGEVWQEVRTFVTNLRSAHLPVIQPIVVLVPTLPPDGLLEGCNSRVIVVKGDRHSARTLMRAGILEASAVVVMTGEGRLWGHVNEPVFRDSQVMLLAHQLECWCGISTQEVFTVYELQHSRSLRYIPPITTMDASQLEKVIKQQVSNLGIEWQKAPLEEEDDFRQSMLMDALEEAEEVQASFDVQARASGTSGGTSGDVWNMGLEDSVLFHPRFAAGQIFSPELWGTMFGRAYYNPAIIETVEALIMPHRRGLSSFPWQIRVPEGYAGMPFGHLVRDMALGGWDRHCDLEQAGSEPSRSPRPSDRRSGFASDCRYDSEASRTQAFEGPAVPIALYRMRDDFRSRNNLRETAKGTGGHNYTFLAPPPWTLLQTEDWILVLGSRRFGKKACRVGLLRGNGRCFPQAQGLWSARRAAMRRSTPMDFTNLGSETLLQEHDAPAKRAPDAKRLVSFAPEADEFEDPSG